MMSLYFDAINNGYRHMNLHDYANRIEQAALTVR